MLEGRRILVVEDDFFLAQHLQFELEDAGAIVLGPEPSVRLALERIVGESRVDGAVLDVNLGGEQVHPVADALAARRVPFLFATGHRDEQLGERYPDAPRLDKPFNMRELVRALADLVGAAA